MTRLPLVALLGFIPALGLVSCKSSTPKGLPKNLPKINVSSSAAPPSHNMSRGEYPFDARGNYVAAWAAEGSRGAGRLPPPQPDPGSSSYEHEEPPAPRVQSTPPPPPISTPSRVVVSSSPPPARPSSSYSAPAPTVRTSPPARKTPTTASSSSRKPSTSKSSSKSSGSVSHNVKPGDTLYGLALRYKSTVAKIKSANGLKSDLIRPGQTLRIPR
jgi:LysM repeat protein